ncbi:MAG: hypothetical protein IJY47_07740 [Clostridia bacterium]|nr:hypothetical protein [Clostridia bacterium]
MKKLLIVLLALMLTITSFVMGSCDKKEEETKEAQSTTEEQTTEEQTTEEQKPQVPAGYQLYDDGIIMFAYPEGWTKTNGSTVVLKGATGRNNITVVYEAKTGYYESLTRDTFISEMKPLYASMGMTLSNETVTQLQNEQGTKITEITYFAVAQGTSLKQTQLITTLGERTYTITLSEFQTNDALNQTLFDTLAKAK